MGVSSSESDSTGALTARTVVARWDVPGQSGQQFGCDGAEEPFDLAASARLSG